jgi:hypothetical protein
MTDSYEMPAEAELDDDDDQDLDAADDEEIYRPVCTSAVISLIFGLGSFVALFDWVMLIVPAIGLYQGLTAFRRIRLCPEDISGGGLALTGAALSTVLGLSGAGVLTYGYLTEAPPGYLWIAYSTLQPEQGAPTDTIPPAAKQLDGLKVYVKGYMYPGAEKSGIKRFTLCRDNGTCCFGGPAPKLTDMIDVVLEPPLQAEYTTRTTRVGGTFHIEPGSTGGMDAVYRLEADYLK